MNLQDKAVSCRIRSKEADVEVAIVVDKTNSCTISEKKQMPSNYFRDEFLLFNRPKSFYVAYH